MKPVAGIMPLWDEERDSVWMLPGYIDGIRAAGGTAVVFPFTDDEEEIDRLMRLCDGFLFTGGQDVSPKLYGEQPMQDLIVGCGKRDAMEKIVLQKAVEQDKPVLGICRGIQFINAILGGSLYQDLNMQHPSEVKHRMNPPYDGTIHDINVVRESPLGSLIMKCCPEYDHFDHEGKRTTAVYSEDNGAALKGSAGKNAADSRAAINKDNPLTLAVNSHHHQAVKELAPGLTAMAYSTDGLVEAVYRPASRFLWAVQWHPEFLYKKDIVSRAIFEKFTEAMES